jgi:hypothetical protein
MAKINVEVIVKEDFRKESCGLTSIKYDLFLNGVCFDWCKIYQNPKEVSCGFGFDFKEMLGLDDLEIIEKYLVEDPCTYQVASPNCNFSNDVLFVSEDGESWGVSNKASPFGGVTYYFTDSEYKNICEELDIPFDLFKKVEEEEK